ncbi:glycosyltransferase [Caldiplasma sukawensis]
MQGALQKIQERYKEREGCRESRLGMILKADVVITVLNEEKNISRLLEALLPQEAINRIIIVDSMSEDRTAEIVKSFKNHKIFFHQAKCSRGQGRNIGAGFSDADVLLFTDGDAIPHKNWVNEILKCMKDADVVAGSTVQVGKKTYSSLERVKLYVDNFEVTLPSMNLAYRRDLFIRIGGFDPYLITAEDIDLNIRAKISGARTILCRDAIIYHNVRENFRALGRQAFWNGYGRYQLRAKYGKKFSIVKKDKISLKSISFIWMIRNMIGIVGYLESFFRIKSKIQKIKKI